MAAAGGTGGWGANVTAFGSQPLDIRGLTAAGGRSGAATLAFSLGDIDAPGSAVATVLTGRHGRFGAARVIVGADAVLGAASLSNRSVVLLGSAPENTACCSSISGLVVGPGALHAGRPFLDGLDGPAQARLLPDGRRLLAVIATDRGVWASLSSTDGRHFGRPRRLSAAALSPQSVAALPAGSGAGNGVTIAFSARAGGLTADGPGEIFTARAPAGQLPVRARLAVRVARGHAVDELALAAAATPELAWVESEVDRHGEFRSVVRAVSLGARVARSRTISASSGAADGLSASGTAGGPMLVAWRACSRGGRCSAMARIGRPAPRAETVFGSPRRLGEIDPDQVPVSVSSADGTPFAGWIGGGAVRAVRVPDGIFGHPSVLVRSAYATGLTMGAVGSNGAQAAWVEGTARQRVVVATWLR